MSVALAIIDMQNDFVVPGAPLRVAGAAATVPTLAQLLETARSRGWFVFHVNREHRPDGSDAEITRRDMFVRGEGYCIAGTRGVEIVEGLEPLPGEFRVVKKRFSAFHETELDMLLRRLGVTTLVIGGTQYPNCVRGTAVDALARDYRVVVVTDACSAADEETARANVRDMRAMGVVCTPLAELESTLATS
jgi:nicotinamidase-related amidase